ncbi:hypothetical protein LX36DRAFT_283449 [Colletotrichum falcatum]|nr:hypothetical protein LX36DRAFT_283449 [Colletotrichum falcatum]
MPLLGRICTIISTLFQHSRSLDRGFSVPPSTGRRGSRLTVEKPAMAIQLNKRPIMLSHARPLTARDGMEKSLLFVIRLSCQPQSLSTRQSQCHHHCLTFVGAAGLY